jgi:DNA repair protein RadC
MDTYKSNTGIKSWAEEDRPREKFIKLGKQNLTDTELLAIIIRSGSGKKSAVALSKEILSSVDYNLNELARLDIRSMTSFSGVGLIKAITLSAALELGNRRKLSEIKKKIQIKSSSDAYDILFPTLSDLNHEEFWVLLLNRNNRIIKKVKISSGGVSGTVVDHKMIFKSAIEVLASSIILCHNHPSGNLKPSNADIEITQTLKKAGEFLDIKVLDHLIISEEGYFSFADESYL